MRGERVLLVGGNGFIGRALGQRLVAEGREVHVLARHADPGVRDGIVFHRACQSSAGIVAPLVAHCGVVAHLASATTPGRSANVPTLDVVENLLPLAGFFEALAATPPEHLLFISSGGAIYGNPQGLPVTEDCPRYPLSWHAAGKLAAEAMFETFARQTGTPLVIIRPANVYGPGQLLQPGFGLVRTLLEKAWNDEAVELWGGGHQLRDFLYVDDLVDACARLLGERMRTGVFNAGSGVGVSLLDVVELTRKVTGRALPVIVRPVRGIDVERIYLDCQRLHEALSWRAVTTLEVGLERTWKWLSNR